MRAQLCLTLFDPMAYTAHQAPLDMEFSKQEYWSGLPFPTPGDLPDPGIEPVFPIAPALADGFFTTEPTGMPSSPQTMWKSYRGPWGGDAGTHPFWRTIIPAALWGREEPGAMAQKRSDKN